MNTAKLTNVEIYIWPTTGKRYACGLISEDSQKRFIDNYPVRTSYIEEIKEGDGVTQIKTLNTTYTVVGKILHMDKGEGQIDELSGWCRNQR